jgi:hypothetical protein
MSSGLGHARALQGPAPSLAANLAKPQRHPRPTVGHPVLPASRTIHSLHLRPSTADSRPPTNASSSRQSDELRAQARSCTQKASPSVWQPNSRSPRRHPRPTLGHPVLPASKTFDSLHLKPLGLCSLRRRPVLERSDMAGRPSRDCRLGDHCGASASSRTRRAPSSISARVTPTADAAGDCP